MWVLVCMSKLASPFGLCLCVFLLKDLHSGVSPSPVKSCLVPLHCVSESRRTLSLCVLSDLLHIGSAIQTVDENKLKRTPKQNNVLVSSSILVAELYAVVAQADLCLSIHPFSTLPPPLNEGHGGSAGASSSCLCESRIHPGHVH